MRAEKGRQFSCPPRRFYFLQILLFAVDVVLSSSSLLLLPPSSPSSTSPTLRASLVLRVASTPRRCSEGKAVAVVRSARLRVCAVPPSASSRSTELQEQRPLIALPRHSRRLLYETVSRTPSVSTSAHRTRRWTAKTQGEERIRIRTGTLETPRVKSGATPKARLRRSIPARSQTLHRQRFVQTIPRRASFHT